MVIDALLCVLLISPHQPYTMSAILAALEKLYLFQSKFLWVFKLPHNISGHSFLENQASQNRFVVYQCIFSTQLQL